MLNPLIERINSTYKLFYSLSSSTPSPPINLTTGQMVGLETEEGHDTRIAHRVSPVTEAAIVPGAADLIPVKLTRRGLPDQNHG